MEDLNSNILNCENDVKNNHNQDNQRAKLREGHVM